MARGSRRPGSGLSPAHVALKAHQNIFYKFSTVNIEGMTRAKVSTSETLRHDVDVYGADHVMWGSDMGNTPGAYEVFAGLAADASTQLSLPNRSGSFARPARGICPRGRPAWINVVGWGARHDGHGETPRARPPHFLAFRDAGLGLRRVRAARHRARVGATPAGR